MALFMVLICQLLTIYYASIGLVFSSRSSAICGVSNAYNILDGLNGLASIISIVSLIAVSLVAFQFGDSDIVFMSLMLVASIAGFLLWNYPTGKIFLGDAGAYLIGFCSGFLALLLVNRHLEISPWFAFLLNIYPDF
jgi:UDP-N-acetylmuramyl pentapeptide phosphotransferase/UDP-N-acetylglucosamine-1-phosphate transferase